MVSYSWTLRLEQVAYVGGKQSPSNAHISSHLEHTWAFHFSGDDLYMHTRLGAVCLYLVSERVGPLIWLHCGSVCQRCTWTPDDRGESSPSRKPVAGRLALLRAAVQRLQYCGWRWHLKDSRCKRTPCCAPEICP